MKISQILLTAIFCFTVCLVHAQDNLKGKYQLSTKDTVFLKPYVDQDEWRNTPVRHRYVHGGFEGTETRFSFYFPEKQHYQGRFFQYITPP
ncbi:hypothetical protein [Flectobacillus longus]|uniref:hypothetical protein n=1 Tax=Flectobacillus longus TaxID=2984207 RepID=UPI0024B78604|nr:hypothetical protein [Flectobacillus longus]MDI9877834.1 hypothetical protein [Flectobacillus longus]